jgi:hypothetical protein
MKKLSLKTVVLLLILLASVGGAIATTTKCINIMQARICVLYDDAGNKIGDAIIIRN